MPSFEAVTKHAVSDVPRPSVGTVRVAVWNGVFTIVVGGGNGVRVGREANLVGNENVGRNANVESTVVSGNVGRNAGVGSREAMGVLATVEVAEKISGLGGVCVSSPTGATGVQASRISIMMFTEKKKIFFILHSPVFSSGWWFSWGKTRLINIFVSR
jgi:hypothetical protein